MSLLRILGGLLLIASAFPAAAQEARLSTASPRVLFAVSDSVKLNDGTRGRLVTTVTYDPVAGRYVTEMRTADRLLSRRVQNSVHIGPTPTERAVAESLVSNHPEVADLIASARGEVFVEGGFPLVREEGDACGPGGRCLMYDVFAVDGDERQRLRFVIVDLRAVRVLDADADADADTNFASPAARRSSRR